MFPRLLLLVLTSQWTLLHARSVAGDYRTQQDYPAQSFMDFPSDPVVAEEYVYGRVPDYQDSPYEFPSDPVLFDTQSNTQLDMPTFTKKTGPFQYSAMQGSEQRPIEMPEEYDSFASTESDPTFDTFINSPEVVDDASLRSFSGDTVYENDESGERRGFHTQYEYENDEVFFNTSSARTIYRGMDNELSLAAVDMLNATTADDTLASLAKVLGGCGTGNPIDDCWRCDLNWRSHRQALAGCVTGFGRNAEGGKNGPIYVVTRKDDDDPEYPRPGTLRHALSRNGPLWITFAKSMTIKLKGELWVNSYKTIDGRGADVHVVGAQITIQNASHVIVHGIHIHDIEVTGPTAIRVSPTGVVLRVESDGDALHILNSKHVWVDHCYLAKASDGLLDATRGSTMITVSNCLFENHNKVLLFGSSPTWTADRNMKATVAFNKFGKGLIQRMPRCRFGVFHILNNDYSEGWDKYAIGGSENPTILSEGNYFRPTREKEVTKRIDDNGPTFGSWENWNWVSSGDIFLDGSYFTGSGAEITASVYADAFSTSSRPGHLVPAFTKSAGPLKSVATS